MPVNGTPRPGRYRKRGGKHTRGGCLPMIAVPAIGLLTLLVAAMTTG